MVSGSHRLNYRSVFQCFPSVVNHGCMSFLADGAQYWLTTELQFLLRMSGRVYRNPPDEVNCVRLAGVSMFTSVEPVCLFCVLHRENKYQRM